MPRKKLKLGEMYRIDFLDHSYGFHMLFACKVVGWLVKETKDAYVLATWLTDDQSKVLECDKEVMTIAKGCVKNVRHIRGH